MTRRRANFSAAAAAILVLALAAATDASRLKHYHKAPIIDLSGAEELIGLVREDERVVTVSPQLRILRETGPICRYELSRAGGAGGELPFESHVLDMTEGTARIRVRPGSPVDCSAGGFRLQLVAVRCADDTARSEPVTLKITVKDTNDHAPEFEAPWYSFDVDEGKIGEIARLYATDADCGHPYGRVCRYEITNAMADSDFQIDDQGALSAVRPLNASHAESHLLTVVAHDCGMLASKSTLVTIHVRAKCANGIVAALPPAAGGAAHRPPAVLQATTGAETSILPNADIVLCPLESTCTVKSAETEISLAAVPAPLAIGADAPKRCGLSPATVDLLPDSVALKASSTAAPPTDDDEEEEEEQDAAGAASSNVNANAGKHFFDGKTTAVTVSSSAVSSAIPQKFTVSFAMKHNAGTSQEQTIKENILCETDDFAMNRHHFAVYVRHCKLELLLRREAAGAKAEFRAAEWRWETPEVCDNRWHAYAIRFVDLDNVELFVDGRAFGQTNRNPEILDDWSLHDTKQHKTRLVVGACWHGRNVAMVQHFRGHLARVFLWAGGAESPAALRCLHGERAKLTFGAINRLVPGESIVTDKTQSKLTLKATSLKNLAALLRAVKFEASADATSPSSRRFVARTNVICAEANRTIPLGEHAARVDIVAPTAASAVVPAIVNRQPQLSIGGQTLLSVQRRHLKSGTPLMPNIQLVVTQPTADGSLDKDVTAEHQLDWCKLHLKPSRDMDLEYFSSPAALISFLNVDFEHDKQGIMLNGKESVKNYADVLSKIRYYNTRPETYSKRIYTVQCAMMGGKILSNELFVQMDIVDNEELEDAIGKLGGLSNKLDKHARSTSSPTAAEESEILKLEEHFEPSFNQLGSNRLQNMLEMDLPRPKAFMGTRYGYEMGQGAVAGSAVAVVVVICIGFLLVLLVIGVMKMRDSPLPSRRARRSRKPTMEGMEWDDNGMGMNITVNPLMDVNKTQRDGAATVLDGAFIYGSDAEEDEESLEDENESYREEDELTDDEEEDVESSGCRRGDRANSATCRTLLPHTHDAGGKQRLEWDDCTLADALPPSRGHHV